MRISHEKFRKKKRSYKFKKRLDLKIDDDIGEESKLIEIQDINKPNKNHKIGKIILIFLIIFSVFIISRFHEYYLIPKENLIISNKSLSLLRKVNNFFDLCSKGILLYKKRFKKNKNPKFSLVIPVLNKIMYLERLIKSIQNQLYENIEIIFVDDCSNDGSIQLIQKYMRKDKRIILIQHKKNMGTLITRNEGVLNSSGEYIIFLDPDDMILDNSLQTLYEITLKYSEIDIIQFRALRKRRNYFISGGGYHSFDKIVEQPELSSIMFYKDGHLEQTNYFIWGKIFKRKVCLEGIDKIGDYYRNQYMTLYEDVAMLFIFFSVAKNYIFVNIFGYLYCISNLSVFTNRFKYRKGNRTIRDCFLVAEFLFDFSNNTTHDKLMALYLIKRINWMYYHVCSFVTEGFDYIFKVLNKFINCEYLNKKHKYFLYNLKNYFEDIQKKVK